MFVNFCSSRLMCFSRKWTWQRQVWFLWWWGLSLFGFTLRILFNRYIFFAFFVCRSTYVAIFWLSKIVEKISIQISKFLWINSIINGALKNTNEWATKKVKRLINFERSVATLRDYSNHRSSLHYTECSAINFCG